jgi:predicted RNA-binding Zn ribbon-like protein
MGFQRIFMSNHLPPAIFIGGSLGIDFLNSVAIPVDEVVEWIGNGKDLVAWLKQAELVTAHDIKIIESNFSASELDRIAKRARELREWFRGFVKAHMGQPLSAKALNKLEPLNELLGLGQWFWTIAPKSAADDEDKAGPPSLIFRLRPQRRWQTAESVLAPIAEEMAKTVCYVDFQYIKGCEGKTCVLLFCDETRRRARRWCSMAVCGNRAKQESFRSRSQ